MGIKTVPHPPYSPDLAPCDFWLFPKLRGRRYEKYEEMKEGVTKVTDTLTQEDFHGAFQNLLERYNKCIAAGEDIFEGDKSFMCLLSIKVPIRKKSWNLFNHPRNCKLFVLSIDTWSSSKWLLLLLLFNSLRIFLTSVRGWSFTGVTSSLLRFPGPFQTHQPQLVKPSPSRFSAYYYYYYYY